MNFGRQNTLDIFIEVYKAYPLSYIHDDRYNHFEFTNSIILPPSALAQISELRDYKYNGEVIYTLRILNIRSHIHTHCIPGDYFAEEGVCYLPQHMFDRLCLEYGQEVNIRNIKLVKGSHVTLRPHKFAIFQETNGNERTILENCINKYKCLTKDDVITIEFKGKSWCFDIVDCKPKDAISIFDTDLKVDFAAARDYDEYEEAKKVEYLKSQKKKLTIANEQNDIAEKQQVIVNKDGKFQGQGRRMDGKAIDPAKLQQLNQANVQKDAAPLKRLKNGLRDLDYFRAKGFNYKPL